MTLEVSEEARRFIAVGGFDPVYGSRPRRRFIAKRVETRIECALLADAIADGAAIRVELKRDELLVTHDDPPAREVA